MQLLRATVIVACMIIALNLCFVTASRERIRVNRDSPNRARWKVSLPSEDENQIYWSTVDRHALNITDLMRVDRIGDPIASPDNNYAVFTRRVWSVTANVSSTTLWILYLDNEHNPKYIPLTPFSWKVSESNPCWSPDSRSVLFISNRVGSSQIWQVSLDANDTPQAPVQISNYPIAVSNLLWSPEGSHLAFSANVYPGLTMEETLERDEMIQSIPTRAFEYEKLMVRHWDEWYDGHRSHPFLVTVTKNSAGIYTLGTEFDVLGDLDSDAPTKPTAGTEEWGFSSNGDEFSFTRRHDETSEMAWSTNLDIFSVSISGPHYSTPNCITCSNYATDTQPRYQPNGLLIAYLSTKVLQYESDKYRIKIYNRADQSVITLTEQWDRSVTALSWSPDGSYLIAEALDYARTKIFKVSMSGAITYLVVNNTNKGSRVLNDGSILMSRQSLQFPTNIFRWYPSSNMTFQLTVFNAGFLEKCIMSQPEEFWFAGANNDMIHGWYLPPVLNNATSTSSATTKYKLAYLIHGGPQSSWSDDWSYRWNPNIYAAHGYAVADIDFHGSQGYGQAFTDSIINDYGGKPFNDILLSLDYITSKYPVDSTRIMGLGASYGAWMINWINGHTNRFRCLVAHDGVFDMTTKYYETDELWFPEHDMQGSPLNQTALANYERWNPRNNANQWKTPELIMHGGKDYRVPITHGIATFTALQRQGIPSKLVYFPTENHWVSNPCNSIYWHNVVLAWLDQWAA